MSYLTRVPPRVLSREQAAIEELTAEGHRYHIELKDRQVYVSAYRKGHQWFVDGNSRVAESEQIYAIVIPARAQ